MSVLVKNHLDMLGFPVKDKVTGFKGVVVSIGFDLYGCIQAVVNPGLDKEGKTMESMWFDVNRLEVTAKKRVMGVPNWDFGMQAEGQHGAALKSVPYRA